MADRICAGPDNREYGILTVKLAYWWRVVERFEALAEVGVQHVIFSLAGADDVRKIETLGREVLPRVHAIEAKAI